MVPIPRSRASFAARRAPRDPQLDRPAPQQGQRLDLPGRPEFRQGQAQVHEFDVPALPARAQQGVVLQQQNRDLVALGGQPAQEGLPHPHDAIAFAALQKEKELSGGGGHPNVLPGRSARSRTVREKRNARSAFGP